MSALVKQNNSKLLRYAEGQLAPAMSPAAVHNPTIQPPVNKELTLYDILKVLKRRKWSIIIPIILTVGIAVLYTLSTPSSYRSKVLIQIEREGVQIVTTGQTSASSGGSFNAGQDPFIRTLYEQLKSRTLSEKVIKELNLYNVLLPKKKNSFFSFASIMRAMGFQSKKHTVSSIDYSRIFLDKLLVLPIDGTNLVEVTYEAPSAEGARRVVTSLVNNFIQSQVESKSKTSEYAKGVLTNQLAEARERLRASEASLVEYANAKGILAFDDEQKRHVRNFEALDAALVAAENKRIQAESLYVQMKRVGNVSTVLNNPVITNLKASLVKLEGDYQEMLKTFKPNYPDMQRLNQQIGSIRSKLNREMVNIQSSMEADFLAAKNQEDRIRSELKKFNTKMQNLQDSSLGYNTLKREVETNGKVFNQLLQRLEEVSVASAANTSSITIIEPAIAPFKRYRPKPKLNMVLGLLSGLFIGLGLAFLREALDQKINSAEDLQRISGLPVLGMIPRISKLLGGKNSGKISFKKSQSVLAESFRVLSTNIRFMISGEGEGEGVVLITSVQPRDGKSTTAVNLAFSYSQMGMKVLLVDADLRNASIHKKLGIGNQKGLSQYLKGEIDLVGITQPVKSVPGLYAITAGDYVNNSLRLLTHERMSYLTTQGSKIFDIVIVDAPPVTGFADSLILSSLASSTIIVGRENDLDGRKIKNTVLQLSRVKNNVLGFLLIRAKGDTSEAKYYEKYHKKPKKLARLRLGNQKYA